MCVCVDSGCSIRRVFETLHLCSDLDCSLTSWVPAPAVVRWRSWQACGQMCNEPSQCRCPFAAAHHQREDSCLPLLRFTLGLPFLTCTARGFMRTGSGQHSELIEIIVPAALLPWTFPRPQRAPPPFLWGSRARGGVTGPRGGMAGLGWHSVASVWSLFPDIAGEFSADFFLLLPLPFLRFHVRQQVASGPAAPQMLSCSNFQVRSGISLALSEPSEMQGTLSSMASSPLYTTSRPCGARAHTTLYLIIDFGSCARESTWYKYVPGQENWLA